MVMLSNIRILRVHGISWCKVLIVSFGCFFLYSLFEKRYQGCKIDITLKIILAHEADFVSKADIVVVWGLFIFSERVRITRQSLSLVASIALNEVDCSLQSPIYHESIKNELNVTQLFQSWHQGPVQRNN